MTIERTALKTTMDFMLWRSSLTELHSRLESLYFDHEVLIAIQSTVNKYHAQLNEDEVGKRTMFPPEPVRLARNEIVEVMNRYLPKNAPTDINDTMSLMSAFFWLDRQINKS